MSFFEGGAPRAPSPLETERERLRSERGRLERKLVALAEAVREHQAAMADGGGPARDADRRLYERVRETIADLDSRFEPRFDSKEVAGS
jgi:hypothetical protein